MQLPPLSAIDISLMIAMAAIILLFTSEILSPIYGMANLSINRRKLRLAAYYLTAVFLIVFISDVIYIISGLV